MSGKRFFHLLRLLVVLVVGVTLGALIGGVYYVNETGMSAHWRLRISQELENIGIIADFETLRISPARGLVAGGIRIYSDSSRQDVVAELEHLVIDVDKTKLMRGILRVNKVSLKDANVSLPIDPYDPNAPRIHMTDIRGEITRPDKTTVEAKQVFGMVAGIKLEMDARIWRKKSNQPEQEYDPDYEKDRIQAIARIISELKKWQWPDNHPPKLILNIEGNIDKPESARLDFKLSATELERDGLTLTDIKIIGDYKNNVVTLETIELSDGAGQLNAQADFHTLTQRGRFSANSSLHIQMLARRVLGIGVLQEVTFSTPPKIQCAGHITLDGHNAPKFQLTGSVEAAGFSCLGARFNSLTTNFSAQEADIFLTGIKASHAQGEFKGRILIKNDSIRYEADSTLPPSVYNAFIQGTPLAKALDKADFNENSQIAISANGTMNRSDLTEWAAAGTAEFKNFSYNDVKMHSLSGQFDMSGLRSEFSQITANIDYTDYTLRKRHGGPSSARANVKSIVIDRTDQTIALSNIKTTAWPAPIVKLFVPNIAKHIETYRFHRPPSLVANGVFGLRKRDPRTNFRIDVSSPGILNYDFLGKPLTLQRLRGKVAIKHDRVEVTNLSMSTFDGTGKGAITVFTVDPKKNQYSGAFQWSRLHLKSIGKLYQFDNAERGLLTGRLDFSGKANNLRLFNGKGNLALERGNLFSVPMLGPLSPLIGTVLGKKNPTRQQAEDASCTFVIQKGVLHSNDFLASTRSLKFTGQGNIDLQTQKIDLLFRMNARGLFNIISLPFRPFMGLFQFRGIGEVKNAKWRTVMFTNPKRGKNDPIFTKPPKAKVVNE